MAGLLASIPSPSNGSIDLGPLTLHMYGLMLLAGIMACIGLTGLRWTRPAAWSAWERAHPDPAPRDWDLIFRVAVAGVAAGIVGARLYHDATSWNEVPDPKWRGIFAVWEGGLGVWGGIALGAIVGGIVARRSGHSARRLLDAAAPGLLLAQAIGRIGNWWNQELFGKPTDAAWALEIDPEHRPAAYGLDETFHPTFLYELVWNLAMAAVLIVVARRFRIRPPALFALYVAVYCFGRFFEELLRIDPAHEYAGLRLNAWVSIVVFAAAAVFFVWWQLLRGRRSRPRPAGGSAGPKMAVPKGRVRPSG